MTSQTAWPVVQPLPKIVISLVVAVFFVLGHLLLWNDRRIGKAGVSLRKQMSVPAYK